MACLELGFPGKMKGPGSSPNSLWNMVKLPCSRIHIGALSWSMLVQNPFWLSPCTTHWDLWAQLGTCAAKHREFWELKPPNMVDVKATRMGRCKVIATVMGEDELRWINVISWHVGFHVFKKSSGDKKGQLERSYGHRVIRTAELVWHNFLSNHPITWRCLECNVPMQ